MHDDKKVLYEKMSCWTSRIRNLRYDLEESGGVKKTYLDYPDAHSALRTAHRVVVEAIGGYVGFVIDENTKRINGVNTYIINNVGSEEWEITLPKPDLNDPSDVIKAVGGQDARNYADMSHNGKVGSVNKWLASAHPNMFDELRLEEIRLSQKTWLIYIDSGIYLARQELEKFNSTTKLTDGQKLLKSGIADRLEVLVAYRSGFSKPDSPWVALYFEEEPEKDHGMLSRIRTIFRNLRRALRG